MPPKRKNQIQQHKNLYEAAHVGLFLLKDVEIMLVGFPHGSPRFVFLAVISFFRPDIQHHPLIGLSHPTLTVITFSITKRNSV